MNQRFSIFALFARLAVLSIVGMFSLAVAFPAKAAALDETSYVRVIHASPYVGTADVFVDGKLLLSSFQFASVTDYVPLPAGTHKVQISLVGKGIDASVLVQDLDVPGSSVFTIAALGTKPDALSLQVFADDNSVSPNRAKVRVYHLAPDAGQVNVTVGEEVTLSDVGYTFASKYIDEDTGPCPVRLNDVQYGKSLALDPTLKVNTVTSVFAVGLFQGNPKAQLVEANTPGIPGLPGTGSDPTVAVQPSGVPLVGWLLLGTLVLVLGAGRFRIHSKK